MGASDPTDLEAILPPPRSDGVSPEMAGPRAKGRFRLAGPATYSYFEARRERYGWLRDPSGDVVITTSVLSGQEETGPRHWFILLRHTREGWRVDKPLETSSLEDARIMAAMEWAGRVGYLVDIVDGKPMLGPHVSDLADPVRYLELMKSNKPRKSNRSS